MNSVLNRITHSLSCHKLLTPKKFISRRISILEKARPKPILLNKTNHRVIYEFKYIVFPAAFLKTKFMLPVLCVAFSSACIYFKQWKWVIITVIACVFQLGMIFIISKLTKNLVGKIYVNKKGNIDNIIVSSIDSNGRRIDKSYDRTEFCLVETVLTKYLGLFDMEIAGESKTYKMEVKNSVIHDMNAVKTLFQNFMLFLEYKKVSKNKK